jgi:methionine sulfoxide reductase heme-binding subunit
VDHVFWITSRAAGTAALFLSSAAVCVGLTMGGRLLKGRDLRVTHEALSLATLAALAVHAVSLLGDGFLRPTVADVTVPFVSSYRQPWMTIGIVSGWMMVALGLSYYARGRIGPRRWRSLHRLTALAWIGGLAHSLGEGTDAGTVWFVVATAVVAAPAAALLIVRTLSPGRRPTPAR